jgi:hypothetical protein
VRISSATPKNASLRNIPRFSECWGKLWAQLFGFDLLGVSAKEGANWCCPVIRNRVGCYNKKCAFYKGRHFSQAYHATVTPTQRKAERKAETP